MRTTDGRQRRFPAALGILLAAAALYRAATVLKGPETSSRSLVTWTRAEDAPALAAAKRKPLLYNFHAAWCGPCRRMEEAVFSDPESARYINTSFIAVSIVDRVQEDGRNPPLVDALQKRYEIQAFPTLVRVSADGKLEGKLEGFPGSDGVMEFLKR